MSDQERLEPFKASYVVTYYGHVACGQRRCETAAKKQSRPLRFGGVWELDCTNRMEILADDKISVGWEELKCRIRKS